MKRGVWIAILCFAFGVGAGAWLFSDTQPRSFLNIAECGTNCLSQEEMLGLVGADIHYVIIPKKDIKAAQDMSQEDTPYLIDAYAVMAALIEEQSLRDYKIITNGPGFQTVGYLHFHLVSDLPE